MGLAVGAVAIFRCAAGLCSFGFVGFSIIAQKRKPTTMAADGAAAEVPTPAVFAQGGGASRPGAGWVQVELHATSWKCNFCASSFIGSKHTRVRAGAPGVVRQVYRKIPHSSVS